MPMPIAATMPAAMSAGSRGCTVSEPVADRAVGAPVANVAH